MFFRFELNWSAKFAHCSFHWKIFAKSVAQSSQWEPKFSARNQTTTQFLKDTDFPAHAI